jgi:hypothetical protein
MAAEGPGYQSKPGRDGDRGKGVTFYYGFEITIGGGDLVLRFVHEPLTAFADVVGHVMDQALRAFSLVLQQGLHLIGNRTEIFAQHRELVANTVDIMGNVSAGHLRVLSVMDGL